MTLILLHGPPAVGKLTIGRIIAERTGFALFHNHLVVDAVAALFPFGSPAFIRQREAIWRALIVDAVRVGRDTIFTFAPEPTVTPGFIDSLLDQVRAAGGTPTIVALTIDPNEQDRRLTVPDRAAFGKLTDPAMLAELRPAIVACTAAMPPAGLTVDVTHLPPADAADQIVRMLP